MRLNLLFVILVLSVGITLGLSYHQNAYAVPSPPDVTVTSPINGAMVQSSTVIITGTASSSSATISSVQVSIDGAPYVIATGTTSWSYTANGLASGVHSITAKATDSQGLIGYSTNVVASSGIPIGNGGQELVYDPDNGNIYVANYNPSYNIVVISGSTNQVLATIPDSGGPTGIAYNSVNHYIYTANIDAGTVTVINTANNQVVGTPISVGSHPFGVAYVPNGDIYVANTGSNTVSVIDPATSNVVATIPVGSHPQDFAFDSTNGYLYMTNQGSNTVTVINPSTNSVVGSPIPVGISPRGIAYDPANGKMYVANFGSNTISIIDTSNNNVSTILTGSTGGPNGVAFDPMNGFVYVPDFSGTKLNVIDTATNTFINPVTLPSAPYYYYTIFDPVNSDIYITSGSNVAIVQTQTQFTVTVQSTTTSVSSSANPSTFGNSVTFTATISPNTATGTVTFSIDGTPQAPVTISGGTATLATSTLSVGSHSITAAYSGDTNDLSSTSTITQTVKQTSFSSFTAKVHIEDKYTHFELKSKFTLGTGSSGFNPATDNISLQVGTFSTIIPAGSFKQDDKNYEFKGVINGVHIEASIKSLGSNTSKLKVEAEHANLTGTANPVPVQITIGNNSGTATVNAKIDVDHDHDTDHNSNHDNNSGHHDSK